MKNQPELKPCPFCGEHYTTLSHDYVQCSRCGYHVHKLFWNSRLKEDSLQAENDRLREIASGLVERMERARKILHKGADSMWLMLETSEDAKALKEKS